jgi:hypothetical protein
VSLPERTHLPPKAGDSWGVTLPRATGSENVTEIDVFDATFCAPAAGEDDLTKKPVRDACDVPLDPAWTDVEVFEVEARGCVGGDEPPLNMTIPATMDTTMPTASKSGRRGRESGGRLPRDLCTPLTNASARRKPGCLHPNPDLQRMGEFA